MSPLPPTARRQLAIAVATGLAVLTAPSIAHADIGVPMLALMAVPMWASLLIIIPVEAIVARKLLGGGWGSSLKLAAIPNLVSTLLGVPLTWVLVVVIQWPFQALAAHLYAAHVPPRAAAALAVTGGKVIGVILGGAWLYPYEGEFFWLIPAAGLVLCVPFFYASVWIEYLVGRRLVPREASQLVRRWAWKANVLSYCLLALVPAVLLGVGLVRHVRTANDDEHRSVDLVSADRLWQLAVIREKSLAVEASHPPNIATSVVDGRPKARTRADSLWRVGDDAHRAGDDLRAEQSWVASLAAFDTQDRARAGQAAGGTGSAISPSEAVYSLAKLYYAQRRYHEAKPLLELLVRAQDALLKRGSDYPFPGYPLELAVTYRMTGDSARADEFLSHVVEMASGPRRYSEALHGALVGLADDLLAHGDTTRAEGYYRRALAHADDKPWEEEAQDHSSLQIARICRAQGRFSDARSLLLAGIGRGANRYSEGEFPDSTGAGHLFADLAMVYLDEGDLPPAAHYLKAALRWGSDLRIAAEGQARLLERQGKSGEAKVWRRRASDVTGRT